MLKILILIGLLIIAALQSCGLYSEGDEPVTPERFAAETVLQNDALQTIKNQSVILRVLHNDQTLPNSTLVFGSPANGSIQIDSSGGFLYVPDADFTGSDKFTYRVCAAGNCKHAVVEISVTEK